MSQATSTRTRVTVVGGGLAGCEASFQLAERGFDVRLFEMKPVKRTPAQKSDFLAELVCSNSLRGAALGNAVGLLKEELRRAGSLTMRIADLTAVPAGGALAVDRERFGHEMTTAVSTHPRITRIAKEVESLAELPTDEPVILATGPLTSDGLAADLARLIGVEHLAYYDAIAPIVSAESIDWDKVWKQSRYGKGAVAAGSAAPPSDVVIDPRDVRDARESDAEAGGDEAYVNCPFDEAGYKAFVKALVDAEKVAPRAFEETRYFEGCLPCEVMAERGEQTLAFGPMKPVGLTNPRTGRRPYAVIQLRQEDAAATAYNLVGFQTRMKYADQLRVFRMVPGLEDAEIMRYGSVHRNTFVNAPVLLGPGMELRARPGLYLAGQITGVEGYVESAAGGFLCALMLADKLSGRAPSPPPPTTALGGLLTHLGRVPEGSKARYQPSNITWAQIPPLVGASRKLKKRDRYDALAKRALVDFDAWLTSLRSAPGGGPTLDPA